MWIPCHTMPTSRIRHVNVLETPAPCRILSEASLSCVSGYSGYCQFHVSPLSLSTLSHRLDVFPRWLPETLCRCLVLSPEYYWSRNDDCLLPPTTLAVRSSLHCDPSAEHLLSQEEDAGSYTVQRQSLGIFWASNLPLWSEI